MAEQKHPARLQDVLNYQADTYFTAAEIALIQSLFKNPDVIKVMRKALLPSVGDLELPIEEMSSDVWLAGRDYGQIPEQEIKSIVVGRQEAIKLVMGGLIKLKVIANTHSENAVEEAFKRLKDSAK